MKLSIKSTENVLTFEYFIERIYFWNFPKESDELSHDLMDDKLLSKHLSNGQYIISGFWSIIISAIPFSWKVILSLGHLFPSAVPLARVSELMKGSNVFISKYLVPFDG